MSKRALVMAVVALSWSSAACDSRPAPPVPTAPTVSTLVAGAGATADDTHLTFSGLTSDTGPLTTYAESGFTVTMRSGTWSARTSYGNPAPFVQFFTEPGQTVVGEVLVTLPSPTHFASVDLYSSTTPIPYVIQGLRNSVVQFTLTGTTSNTYGSFRTINNPNSEVVDAVSIALTNTGAGRNPMGFDTLVTSADVPVPPAQYSLSGTVTDGSVGISGARVRLSAGPDMGTSTSTDERGGFRFDRLTEGTVTVTASATNFRSASDTVVLDSDRSVSVRLMRNPNAPTTVPAPSGATTIGFDGLETNGASVDRYAESGFVVAATTPGWEAITTYGHPAPFITFLAEAGTSVTGRLEVVGDAPFTFFSAELYASTTRIPYTMTGTLNGVTVFTAEGEVPNTFGALRQVLNPHPDAVIDRLSIALTNSAAECCRNPMGIDTIIVVK